MKTLEKIFSDENLKEYDEFVKILIKEMLEEDKFYFIMSPDFVTFLRHACKCLIIKNYSYCIG